MDLGERRARLPWVRVMLHDVHFWVPVAVLGAGLLVLGWVR
jgi:hypothetical protein